MLLQRARGKSIEIAGNLFIAGTRFLSRRKWIRAPHQRTEILGQGDFRYRAHRDWHNPHRLKLYSWKMPYMPTQTAVAGNGDVYVADGYGSQLVLHFDKRGEFIRRFGGRGNEEFHLDEAHGIAVDDRGPGPETLLVTSRKQSCLKQYQMDGTYSGKISLPGGYPCRPVIHNDNVLVGLCWSGAYLNPNSGFVVVLDRDNRVVATPGGQAEFDTDGQLTNLVTDYSTFYHVHDVCPDSTGNLYVAQWNAGRTFPFYLERSG